VDQPASIELHLGPDRSHRLAVVLLWLLALTNIALCAENLAWPWLAAAGLLLVALNPWFYGWATGLDKVQIFRDGTAITSGLHGTWKGQGWASPWATILCLEESAGRQAPRVSHVLVCASRNSTSDYRHLLVWNRYPPARARSVVVRSGL